MQKSLDFYGSKNFYRFKNMYLTQAFILAAKKNMCVCVLIGLLLLYNAL